MDDVEIREATNEDAGVFAEYRYRMFRDMEPERDFSAVKDEFVVKSLEYYSRHLGSGEGYDCVAAVDGKVVACGSVIFWERPPHVDHFENKLGYILSIYVEPEYRGMGVARAIMAKLHSESRERGMRKTGLHASRMGRRLYESMGYRENESWLETEL